MTISARRVLTIVALLLAALLPAIELPAVAQQRRATERITLVVEVLERDPRPVIACGYIGMQPRDVTARVLTVEEGTFAGQTILLSWPMCEFSRVTPPNKFRIRIRRRVGQPTTPSTRYLVRSSAPIAVP